MKNQLYAILIDNGYGGMPINYLAFDGTRGGYTIHVGHIDKETGIFHYGFEIDDCGPYQKLGNAANKLRQLSSRWGDGADHVRWFYGSRDWVIENCVLSCAAYRVEEIVKKEIAK